MKSVWANTLVLFIVGAFALAACGKARQRPAKESGSDRGSAAVDSTVNVHILLFGAPPCLACRLRFKKLREVLNALPAEQRARIGVKLYVETGAAWTDAPSLALAKKYRAEEGLDAYPVFLDGTDGTGEPNYKYLSDITAGILSDVALPTAVILDANGKFLAPAEKDADIFAPGASSFVPEKIIARALSHAGIKP